MFLSSLFLASSVETSAPSTEQPPSSEGDAEKPSSTTTSLFGGFTGTSFADLAKNSSTTNSSTTNSKSEPFSFSLTQNSSNGGVDANSTATAPIFGSSSGMSFADLAKTNSTTANSTTTAEPFGFAGFAALAQNSSNGGTTQPFTQSPGSGGKFIGLSNRDTFSNLMAPQNGTAGNDANADDANENADDANYDPHYDPIIALPDETQVSTGEENEVKLFGERAKLYRYDFKNKEVSAIDIDLSICLNKNFNFSLFLCFFWGGSGRSVASVNSKFCIMSKMIHTVCYCGVNRYTSSY